MKKTTLYYIYDAYCGWCFGFAPVMEKVQAAFKNQLQFEVLSGGMITGNRIGPIKLMATYIREAAPRLTALTGVSFSHKYLNEVLEDENYVANSLPPAIALCILKEHAPDQQVALAHEIQNLVFLEGKDLNDINAFLPLAAKAGLSDAEFQQKMADEKYITAAQKEFEMVGNWGISGFPAVVVEKDEKLYLLSQGYQPYENLSATLQQVLEGKIGQQ